MNITDQSVSAVALLTPQKQTGVVLVMALVMLTVLTLIGLSGMSRSTLEMKIASNMQQHNIAFQAAQSRLAFAGADDASNPIDYLLAISEYPKSCNVEDGCVNGLDWVATAEINIVGCDKGIGNSLEVGKGFSYRIFEIEAVGETLTGSSRSVQASAIRYPVKSCGDDL